MGPLPHMTWQTAAISFRERIHRTKRTTVFRVVFQGRGCALKVYHRIQRKRYHVTDREIDPYTCESTAYQRLEESGVSEQGFVPRFYACWDEVDPKEALPHLCDFIDDPVPPAAILLEFIPDLAVFDISTFTESRKERFRRALNELHRVGVYHRDVYPRNFLVQLSTDRILLMDYDIAQTWPPDAIPERWQAPMKKELKLADHILDCLASDTKEGRLDKAFLYYYEYN